MGADNYITHISVPKNVPLILLTSSGDLKCYGIIKYKIVETGETIVVPNIWYNAPPFSQISKVKGMINVVNNEIKRTLTLLRRSRVRLPKEELKALYSFYQIELSAMRKWKVSALKNITKMDKENCIVITENFNGVFK